MQGFASDADLYGNMYDRYAGKYFDKYRAPIFSEPDWTYDNYDKLMPIPTTKGKAKAKPLPRSKKPKGKLMVKADRDTYRAVLQRWLEGRNRRG